MPASYTQAELGRTYIRLHADDTIYTRGAFHRYDRGVWEQVADAVINTEVWDLLEEAETVGMCRPTANLLNGVLHYIQDHVYVAEDRVDAHPDLINLLNGTYSLELQQLLTHDHRHYLTTQLPFAYDRAATAPTWQYWLESSLTKPAPDELAHDPELARFLQEAVGYSLTDDISYHVSFWCHGRGANGKGVLFYALEQLAGTSAAPFNVNLLKRDRYQLADLAGKRVALCSEASSWDNVVEDGDVKALVAGDRMNVRQIRERPFVLTPKVKLWWSMNKLPAVADTSDGFWRRVMVIPFNRSFERHERILDLKDLLFNELAGIFNWAMEGLQRLQANGQFTIPAQVAQQTQEYQAESNIVGLFIDEECKEDDADEVKAAALYNVFKDWCHKNGYKAYSSRSFKRELETLAFFAVRRASGIYYQGLSLNLGVPNWP
jgi:putative DNA primase/helicase